MSEHPTHENRTALATAGQHGLARAEQFFTQEQEDMIRDMYAPTASDLEFRVLLATARARRLNPILGQIHFIKRTTKEKDGSGWTEKDKWTCQVSIDGLRAKAEETGLYDGQDEPEFDWADDVAHPYVARVRVWKKGIGRPFMGVARWDEYVQTYGKNGDPTRMWSQMPSHMLAKCAEALALRKAFPDQLGGLYTGEEMGQADSDDARGRRKVSAPDADGHHDHRGPARSVTALAYDAANATSVDACEAVLNACGARLPKVRAHAWRRMIQLAGTTEALGSVMIRVQDDDLPQDVAEKLLAEINAREVTLRGATGAAA